MIGSMHMVVTRHDEIIGGVLVVHEIVPATLDRLATQSIAMHASEL